MFGMTTSPRYVVRKGSLTHEHYLSKGGLWGDYENARRYPTQDAADKAGHNAALDGNYGIFPCSTPRRIAA